jgi:hypothetical protein
MELDLTILWSLSATKVLVYLIMTQQVGRTTQCCRSTVTLLMGCHLEHEDIVPHDVLKDTVVRNRGSRFDGDPARLSELHQENQDVMKKLPSMNLGSHIDHANLSSIGRLGEKYYLMIVIDGIDFVCPQTYNQVRTHPKTFCTNF